MRGPMLRFGFVFVALLVSATGCTSTPSGAACPTDNAVTYDNFGRDFMQTYCLGCHSVNATNRHGAPDDQNYDTLDDIRRHAAEIDGEAAKGPNATNSAMPELGGTVHARPSDQERELLGQFLACEQP
jgi:uncharacterized membrane protein